jgi:hypothetical protein
MADEPMENLALFRLTDEETAQVIKEAGGGTVTWLRRDGHPTAAYVQIVMVDGQIYTTSTNDCGKNKAWKRDARKAWVFDVPNKGGVSAIGRVVFEEDTASRSRKLNSKRAKPPRMGQHDPYRPIEGFGSTASGGPQEPRSGSSVVRLVRYSCGRLYRLKAAASLRLPSRAATSYSSAESRFSKPAFR